MRAMQVRAAAAMAMAMIPSPTIRGAAQPLQTRESFGLAWQKEMNTAGRIWSVLRAADENGQAGARAKNKAATREGAEAWAAAGKGGSSAEAPAGVEGPAKTKRRSKMAGPDEAAKGERVQTAAASAAASQPAIAATAATMNGLCSAEAQRGGSSQAKITTPTLSRVRLIGGEATGKDAAAIVARGESKNATVPGGNQATAASSGSATKHENRQLDAGAGRPNMDGKILAGDGMQGSGVVRMSVSVQGEGGTHLAASSARGAVPLKQTAVGQQIASGAPQVLASSPAKLDVGVFDGTHGWLRIRAELGAGGAVNASLTASAAAHESLRSALPEMTSYLVAEAVKVSRIAVHRVAEGSSTMAAARDQHNDQPNGEAQEQRQTGDQGQQGAGGVRKNLQPVAQPTGGSTTMMTGNRIRGTDSAAVPVDWVSGAVYGGGIRFPGNGSGGWLNVCA